MKTAAGLRPLSLLAITMLLAGCMSGSVAVSPEGDPPETETGTRNSAPSNTVTGVANGPASGGTNVTPRTVAWTGCSGGNTGFIWPESTGPGDTPPGWEGQADGAFGSTVGIFLVECERLSWGPFERGPIRMVWELHDRFRAPAKCSEGNYTLMWVLASMWFDDKDVAKYVGETYGAPTQYSPIDVRYANASIRHEATWTWGLEGHPASSLAFAQFDSPPNGVRIVDEIAWAHNTTVTLLTLDTISHNVQGQQVLAPGEMHYPMLYAQTGQTDYLGTADYWDSVELSATIRQFGDLQCEQPLP